jgi:hypothetical protein
MQEISRELTANPISPQVNRALVVISGDPKVQVVFFYASMLRES